MNILDPLSDAATISKYLESENVAVKDGVRTVTSIAQAAANQSILAVKRNRERLSDSTDHLDGVLQDHLQLSQYEEIKEISVMAEELDKYYEKIVCSRAFPFVNETLKEQIAQLEEREKKLLEKEAQLEKIIHQRVSDAEAKAKEESTSSKGLFESALLKSEKVFDQNKITRFVCSTISRFQDEFDRIRSERDVEHVTKLFQQTIEPFQTTKMVAESDGTLVKVITNTFSEDCYQDLFLFFFKYYNELLDIYESEQALPSTADELSRIFRKRRKGAEQIIAQMHKKS